MAKQCKLGLKDLIKKGIIADVASDPRTNGMVEGQTYPADPQRVRALDEIGAEYASDLYRIVSEGREIVFAINIPDDVTDSYAQSSQGQRTTHQRNTRNEKLSERIEDLAAGLNERIAADVRKLQDYADKVLLSAKNITKYIKGDSDLTESMSEVWTSLRQDPDGPAKLRMIAQFLSEAKHFLALQKSTIQGMDFTDPLTKDGNEVLVVEIEKKADLYAPIITEFYNFLAQAPESNPIKALVTQAFNDLGAIKAVAHNVHKESALSELFDVLVPKFEKAKAEMEAQIRVLKTNLTKASESQKLAINKKIAKLEQDIKDFTSPENIEKTLVGESADSTQIGKFLVAGMGNKDILIQGFMKIIKDKYQTAEMEFRAIGAEIGERFQALSLSTANIDKAFEDLYTEVEESYYDEGTGEIVTSKVLYFVGETSEKWRTDFTKMKAELSKSGKEIMEKRKQGATAEELASLEEEYDKKKTEYIQWRRANFESEYGDRYQAADAILDTVVEIGGRQVTPREIRSAYYDVIGDIQTRVSALTGIPSEEDIEAINDARKRFEEVKSMAGKVEGTGEMEMAKLFTAHAVEMKEMTERWDISQSSLDRFNTRKADIDKRFEAGEISKEDRDRWYTANTTTVYNPKYWAERRAAVEALNSLAEEMARITGFAKENSLKANYEEMEAVAKKYRDSNSHIDGTKLTPAERDKILRSEEDIESVKQSMKMAYSGFLGAEFQVEYEKLKQEQDSVAAEKDRLRKDDPSNSDFTRARIAEITKRQRELKANEKKLAAKFLAERGASKEDIKAFQELYDKYMGAVKNLSQLTESVETQYYYDTFQAELNKFIGTKTDAERQAKIAKTNVVTIGKVKYKKIGGEFFEIQFDGTPVEESTPAEAIIDHIFRKDFESSTWYLENHFEAERWENGGTKTKMIPIYSWRISEPSDKKWVKEHAPSIAWKRRVIKSEYKNPNFGIGADGLPRLKQGLHQNAEYQALRAKNPALWAFRDYMIDEVFLPAQNEDLGGLRTLGMRVPTIERDMSLYDTAQRKGKDLKQRMKRQWVVTQQDQDEGLYAYSDESGYERKVIPIRFQGRLEAGLVSRNIVETIGQYAGQARMHRARTELQDVAKSIESTLSFQAHTPSSETVDKTAKFLGVFKRNKKRGENVRLETVRNLTDMFVYGENIAETSQQGKVIHKTISNLLGVRAGLLFSELPNLLAKAVGLGGTIGSSGWSQLVNLLGGEVQMLIKTAIKSGSAKFNLSDWAFAKKEYALNSGAFINDIGKVSNRSFWTEFAEFFDAQELRYIDNFGKQIYSKGMLRQVNMHNLAFFKNLVEHELLISTVMAFSRNYLVTSGTEKIALKDAFEMKGGKLVMKDGVSISDEEMSNIRGYIATMLRDINGAYGALDKTHLEQYWVGKAMIFMRKWMVPMVANRYSGKKFNVEQDRVTQGYIRESAILAWVAIRNFNETGFNGVASLFHPSMSVNLTEAEQDALRKTRLEILLLGTMYLVYNAVLGYDPEDEERFDKLRKQSELRQGLTYSLIKAQSEQSTFMPIAGFDEIGKLKQGLLSNTAPIVGDLWNMVRNDINWTIGSDDPFFKEYKRDTGIHEKGDLKIAAHAMKLLGWTSVKQSPIEGIKGFEMGKLRK